MCYLMSNIEKYNNVFKEMFDIDVEALKELHYQDIDEWDSVGHMSLMAALEDSFDIMIDTEDIIDFESYVKGIEILQKYGVNFGV